MRKRRIKAISGARVLSSLRLAAQDVALSRRKQGFESPRERQSNQALFQFRKGPQRSPPIIDLSSNPNAATLGQHARTSVKTVAGFHSAAGRTFSRRLSAQVSASRGRSGLHGTLRHHSGRAEVCRRWAACAAYLPQFNATIRCRSTLGSASKSFATSRIFPVR